MKRFIVLFTILILGSILYFTNAICHIFPSLNRCAPTHCEALQSCPSPCEPLPSDSLLVNGDFLISLDSIAFESCTGKELLACAIDATANVLLEYHVQESPISYISGLEEDGVNIKEIPQILFDTLFNSVQPFCQCNRGLIRFHSGIFFGIETGLAENANSNSGPEGPKYSPNFLFDNSQNVPGPLIQLDKISLDSGRWGVVVQNSVDDSIIVAVIDDGSLTSFIPSSTKFRSIVGSLSYGINVIDWSEPVNLEGHGAMVTETFFNKYIDNFNPTNAGRLRYLPIKALDDCGYGMAFNIACAMYCADIENVDVLNMSLGNYQESEVINQAIKHITLRGNMIVVASAGNDTLNLSNNDHFPSRYAYPYTTNQGDHLDGVDNYVLEVGALCDEYLNRANVTELLDISNYCHEMFVANGIFQSAETCLAKGTSISAPIVAAAVVDSLFRNVPPDEIKNSMKNSDPIINNYHTYYRIQ